MTGTTIGVGSTLWMFDENRRVYLKETFKRGQIWPRGQPIWREHWRPMEVVGETRVSWLVGSPGEEKRPDPFIIAKLPKAAFKNNGCPRGWALCESCVDEHVWAHENRRRLIDAIERSHDPRVLRAVDEALKVGGSGEPQKGTKK